MQQHEPSSDASTLDALAEEFIARHRSGERPSISEYIARQPDLAASIRELFPTLVMMENARPTGSQDAVGGVDIASSASVKVLERLGDYRILREIGRGGMGIVYEAEQEALGRHVALKILPKHTMLDPRQLERFQHEARAAARLHHTNIVPVFGVGYHEGVHYHVMQFIQGLGLDEVLVEVVRLRDQKQPLSRPDKLKTMNLPAPRGGGRSVAPAVASPLTTSAMGVAAALISGQFQCAVDGATRPREVDSTQDRRPEGHAVTVASASLNVCDNRSACQAARSSSSDIHLPGQNANRTESGGAYWNSIARIGVQVADALAYANIQGVLHRDIKPSNLLLDATGTVWVTDFGLAKTAESDRLTHTGDIVGTLRYMAPERFRGHSDIQCDIYSLGMTLYEMLTLRPPFVELDRNKLIRQIAQEEPPRPRSIDRTLPRDLETIVLKAIAKQASDRYQNAESLAADLRRFIEDRPIQARRIGRAERFWRWCRRNPLIAGLAAAVLMLATLLSVGASVMHLVRSERDSALVNLNLAIDAEKAAKRNQQRAEQAENEVKIRSHLAQATAYRHAGQAGRSVRSLNEIRLAMELNPSQALRAALRDEAIACMVLVDLRTIDVPETRGEQRIAFDRSYQRYATFDQQGKIQLHRIGELSKLGELPGLGHANVGLVLSYSGNYLAASDGFQAQIWHVESGRAVFPKPIQSNARPSLTRDESRAAIVLPNGSVGVYELASGSEVDRLTTGVAPTVIGFDPGGLRLAVASANPPAVEVWNLATKTIYSRLANIKANIHTMSWDAEGQRITVGLASPADWAEVWEVETTTKLSSLIGHSQDVIGSYFDPSGAYLVTRSWDGFARVWEASSARPLLAWPGEITGSLSTDGRILGKIHDRGHNRLVELVAEQEYQTLVSRLGAGKGEYLEGNISPDGRLLAVGMGDGARIWDLHSNREVAFLPTGRTPSPIFTPNGNELITSGESGLQRWPLKYRPPPTLSASDNATLESLEQSLLTGDAAPATESHLAESHLAESHLANQLQIGPPRDVPLTGDSKYISLANGALGICSPRPNQALVVDLASDRIQTTLGPHSNVDRIKLSPDGRWAATYGWHSPTLKIWDAQTAELAKEFKTELFLAVIFSPDSQRLIVCDKNEYCIWDVGTWKKIQSIAREHCPYPGIVAFSSDGQLMALELSSAIVCLVDVTSGETVAKLEDPHRDRPTWMNFTPDGARFVTISGFSHNIHVWELSLIRAKLGAMGLDWDAGPHVRREQAATVQPVHITVELGDFGLRAESKRKEKQAQAFFYSAYEHSQSQRWADALLAFKQAVELRPENALYNNNLAWLLASCPDLAYRDIGRALELARKSVELEPEAAEYWNTLGVAYYRVGEWQQAIDSLTKAEQLKPDVYFAHNAFFLAMANWRLGNKEAAREFYEKAVDWTISSNPSAKDLQEIEQFRAEANVLFER